MPNLQPTRQTDDIFANSTPPSNALSVSFANGMMAKVHIEHSNTVKDYYT